MPPKPTSPAKLAIIGSYLPRRCGIATFSADLFNALLAQEAGTELATVAMNDGADTYDYSTEVQFEIDQKTIADYRLAVDFLNLNGFDGVSLQHEFGIYGGKAGNYILRLLNNLRLPVVTTLHTVLEEPDRDQREVLTAIAELSDRLVVMSDRAKEMLARVYGIPETKIAMIPHGVPDMPFLDTSYHKDKYGLIGKKVLLTFGLLSRGKGLEYAIQAMPEIVAAHPDAVFMIAGQTHPGVRRHEGETYRAELKARAEELGVGEQVIFRDRFLDTPELLELLSIADVVVTPYLNREQIVSGVLSFALGAGKAIVATPYWYAKDMLADGRGRLVPFRDGKAIAREVVDLLSNDVERQSMRKRAYMLGREMVWKEIGGRYLQLFTDVRGERRKAPRIYRSRSVGVHERQIAPPSFEHLHVLTDDTGILQHARFAIPDRDHGYCTDDNARALIVALMARHLPDEASRMTPLISRYMSFLQHAFNPEAGRFRNFMGFDRVWQESIGSEDSHGRALWALGNAVLDAPSQGVVGAAMVLFERALPAVHDFASPRACAFALLGIDACLRRFNGASDARRARQVLSERLYARFAEHATPDWPWLEDSATYANAVIAEAMIGSGAALGRREMVDAGLLALRWLIIVQTDRRGHFVPIGNDGWLQRGGAPARFDQQPIEIQHTVSALIAAHKVTGQPSWLDDARRCHEWFLGRNDVQQPVVDTATGGSRDGLSPDGLNQNQGAESTLAWLHTSLELGAVLGVAEPAEEPASQRRPALKVITGAQGLAAPH